MRKDIIIIGGGIVGLSVAYNILKMRKVKLAVFEKKYIGYGASTRNASHFRVHFWTEENTKFAIKSLEIIANFASKFGWNPLRYLSGYLWLLYDEQSLKVFENNNERLWSKLGFPVKILDKYEVKKCYPYINTDGLYAAILGEHDGKIHHDFMTFGYYYGIKKLGGEIIEYTPVNEIIVKGDRVIGVRVNSKVINTDIVVVAAGSWSRDLLKSVGVDLPLEPVRKEICVTEPAKPFIKPFIIDTRRESRGLYICQTIRGEVMGSIDYPEVKNTYSFTNTLKWLTEFSKLSIRLIPALKYLKFLRIWSGNYNMTPDHSHILGRDNDWPEGLYVATGYSGHGFMMAPYSGVVLAKYVLDGVMDELLKPYMPSRFKTGRLIKEEMVIG